MKTKRNGNIADMFPVSKRSRNVKETKAVVKSKPQDTKTELRYKATIKGSECRQPSLFKVIMYESKGVENVSNPFGPSARSRFDACPLNQKVCQHIVDYFNIPGDFEYNLRYGARSGMCYEERLVNAFENNLLHVKDPEAKLPFGKLCRRCGKTDNHLMRNCPDVLRGI